MKEENFVRHVQSMRLRWLGHIERMPKHPFHGHTHIIGVRKGRSRKRWLEDMELDVGRMGIKGKKYKA